MAKTKIEPLDDDLDLDELDEYDFDQDEFGEFDPPEDNRSPVVKLATSVVNKFNPLKNGKQIAGIILKNALPSSYIDAYNLASDFKDAATDMYEDVQKQSDPLLRSAEAHSKKLMPMVSNFLPHKLAAKVLAFGKEEPDDDSYYTEDNSGSYDDNSDSSTIDSTLKTIFGAERLDRDLREKKQRIYDEQETALRGKQFAAATGISADMAKNISRLTSYQLSVTDRYYRESIKLQYMQYYATRDLLSLSKDTSFSSLNMLGTIVKNTGLPNEVKATTSEIFATKSKELLIGRSQELLREQLSQLPNRIVTGVKSNVTDFIDTLSGSMDMAMSMVGGGDEFDEDMYTAIGGSLGDAVVNSVGSRIARKLRQKAPGVMRTLMPDVYAASIDLGNRAKGYTADWQAKLNERIQDPDATGVFAWLQDMVGGISGNTEVINHNLRASATTPVPWDLLSRRTLIEIIPGYFSRLLQETINLGNILSGRDIDNDRTVYSAVHENFVKQSVATDKASSALRNTFGTQLKDNTDTILNYLDPDGTELTTEERIQLGMQLALDSSSGKSFDARRYADENRYTIPNGEKYAELFKEKFHISETWNDITHRMDRKVGASQFSTNEEKNAATLAHADLTENFARIRDNVGNFTDVINSYYMTGDLEPLRQLGLVTADEKLNYGYKNKVIEEYLRAPDVATFAAGTSYAAPAPTPNVFGNASVRLPNVSGVPTSGIVGQSPQSIILPVVNRTPRSTVSPVPEVPVPESSDTTVDTEEVGDTAPPTPDTEPTPVVRRSRVGRALDLLGLTDDDEDEPADPNRVQTIAELQAAQQAGPKRKKRKFNPFVSLANYADSKVTEEPSAPDASTPTEVPAASPVGYHEIKTAVLNAVEKATYENAKAADNRVLDTVQKTATLDNAAELAGIVKAKGKEKLTEVGQTVSAHLPDSLKFDSNTVNTSDVSKKVKAGGTSFITEHVPEEARTDAANVVAAGKKKANTILLNEKARAATISTAHPKLGAAYAELLNAEKRLAQLQRSIKENDVTLDDLTDQAQEMLNAVTKQSTIDLVNTVVGNVKTASETAISGITETASKIPTSIANMQESGSPAINWPSIYRRRVKEAEYFNRSKIDRMLFRPPVGSDNVVTPVTSGLKSFSEMAVKRFNDSRSVQDATKFVSNAVAGNKYVGGVSTYVANGFSRDSAAANQPTGIKAIKGRYNEPHRYVYGDSIRDASEVSASNTIKSVVDTIAGQVQERLEDVSKVIHSPKYVQYIRGMAQRHNAFVGPMPEQPNANPSEPSTEGIVSKIKGDISKKILSTLDNAVNKKSKEAGEGAEDTEPLTEEQKQQAKAERKRRYKEKRDEYVNSLPFATRIATKTGMLIGRAGMGVVSHMIKAMPTRINRLLKIADFATKTIMLPFTLIGKFSRLVHGLYISGKRIILDGIERLKGLGKFVPKPVKDFMSKAGAVVDRIKAPLLKARKKVRKAVRGKLKRGPAQILEKRSRLIRSIFRTGKSAINPIFGFGKGLVSPLVDTIRPDVEDAVGAAKAKVEPVVNAAADAAETVTVTAKAKTGYKTASDYVNRRAEELHPETGKKDKSFAEHVWDSTNVDFTNPSEMGGSIKKGLSEAMLRYARQRAERHIYDTVSKARDTVDNIDPDLRGKVSGKFKYAADKARQFFKEGDMPPLAMGLGFAAKYAKVEPENTLTGDAPSPADIPKNKDTVGGLNLSTLVSTVMDRINQYKQDVSEDETSPVNKLLSTVDGIFEFLKKASPEKDSEQLESDRAYGVGDILRRRAAKKDKTKPDAANKDGDGKESAKSEDDDSSSFLEMLAGGFGIKAVLDGVIGTISRVKGIFTSIYNMGGKLGKVFELITNVGTKLASGLGWISRLLGVGGAVAETTAVAGTVASAGTTAAAVGASLYTGAAAAGTVIASGATATMAAGSSFMGLVGSGAIGAALLTNPVGWAVLAGTAVYGGYKAYQYFTKNDAKLKPLALLRFLQYGVPVDNEHAVLSVKLLEKTIEDDFEIGSNAMPVLKISLEDIWSEVCEDFGSEEDNIQNYQNFAYWFNNRFLPVYTKHTLLGIAFDKTAINDLDDDIDAEDKQSFVVKAQFTEQSESGGIAPMRVTTSPWADIPLANNATHISTLTEQIKNDSKRGDNTDVDNLKLIKPVKPDERKETKPKKNPVTPQHQAELDEAAKEVTDPTKREQPNFFEKTKSWVQEKMTGVKDSFYAGAQSLGKKIGNGIYDVGQGIQSSYQAGKDLLVGNKGSAKLMMKILMERGWSKAQAAGLAANVAAESGFKIDALGDNGKAYGIAQWHPDRQLNFKRVIGKDIRDSRFEEQVAFLHWELTNSGNGNGQNKKAGDLLRTIDDPAKAAAIVEQKFERSSLGLRGGVQPERVNAARGYFAFSDEDISSAGGTGSQIIEHAKDIVGMGDKNFKGVPLSDLPIKSGEATAGGPAQEGTTDLARATMGAFGDKIKAFTAFNDAYHQRKAPTSMHTKGLAFDLTTNNAVDSEKVSSGIKAIGAKAGVDVNVINEYIHPSKNSTGGHVHTNFRNPADAAKFASVFNSSDKPEDAVADDTTQVDPLSPTAMVNSAPKSLPPSQTSPAVLAAPAMAQPPEDSSSASNGKVAGDGGVSIVPPMGGAKTVTPASIAVAEGVGTDQANLGLSTPAGTKPRVNPLADSTSKSASTITDETGVINVDPSKSSIFTPNTPAAAPVNIDISSINALTAKVADQADLRRGEQTQLLEDIKNLLTVIANKAGANTTTAPTNTASADSNAYISVPGVKPKPQILEPAVSHGRKY